MFRFAVFLLVLFSVAAGFAWLADHPGTVLVQWPWADVAAEVSLMVAAVALLAIVVGIMLTWWVIAGILNSPKSFGRWREGRHRDKGYSALSRGLVAAGSGNAPLARKLTRESEKYLNNEPLVAMLDAQTALLEGNKGEARKKFESMLAKDDTKLLGLRGLYLEAQQENEPAAAAHFANEAANAAPGTPWAVEAVLEGQTTTGNWAASLNSLENARATGSMKKEDYNRKKAVLLTALAMSEEDVSPDKAKTHALAAHKLAPDLVPAAVTAARVSSRLNDMRKAAKVLEASWKLQPHPEIADTYIHLRSGDSALDRLKRAQTLVTKRANHTEGQFAVARAALDAGQFDTARDAMQAALRMGPTERACLLMADIEEAEHGDRGRVRQWLSRAVTAPRDEAWTADGVVSDDWAPVSPVTGKLDAFEWKVPVEQLGRAVTNDYSKLAHEPLDDDEDDIEDAETLDMKVINAEPETPVSPVKPVSPADVGIVGMAAGGAVAAATTEKKFEPDTGSSETELKEKPDVEDAIVIDSEIEKPAAKVGSTSPESTNSKTEEVPKADPKPAENINDETAKVVSDSANSNEIEPDKNKASEAAAQNGSTIEKSSTESSARKPYVNTDFDPDSDGVIDRRPDDPGVKDGGPKKKTRFF